MKSEAQRRYLHSQHPEVAAEFEAATPKGTKLPAKLHPGKSVKKAFIEGFSTAITSFGVRLAASAEIRMKIPQPSTAVFHGVDKAWKDVQKRGADHMTSPLEPQADPEQPVEKLTEMLQSLDVSGGQGEMPTRSPLDRVTSWSAPSHPGSGETGNHNGVGPSGGSSAV